jgi:hypothetical protein
MRLDRGGWMATRYSASNHAATRVQTGRSLRMAEPVRAPLPVRYNADSLKIGRSMKIRTLSIACGTTAALLLAGCTAFYKNTDACEQMMRSKLADVTPEQLPNVSLDKLSVSHTGTGIHGSRVVVEATLSHMQTASEVAAANAPKGASGVGAASDAATVSAGASQAGSTGTAASNATVSGAAQSGAAASGVAVATAPASGASATVAAAKPAKPVKPKKVTRFAAVECTFDGLNLASFRWLSPAELVKTNDAAAGDTEE